MTLWRNKYEALAKLYSQLRNEHLDMIAKYKGMQLKANSAQEAIDRMERMERDVKVKNLELADMIRERDRARFEVDRMKSVSPPFSSRLRPFFLEQILMYGCRPPESEGGARAIEEGSSLRRGESRRRLEVQGIRSLDLAVQVQPTAGGDGGLSQGESYTDLSPRHCH